VVLIEALAAARPVVATCVGGVPELVIHGQTGLLVPPGDAASLADAVQRIADDRAWADSLGRNGRQHVRKEFRNDVSAKRLAELFAGENQPAAEQRTAELVTA
jgi:glycosyltransferase involved in cell wall biosynthesis